MVTGSRLHRQLKLRHLHLLEMLNATRSMRLTAQRLNISPAAVSKSCIEIEALLGQRLFERVHGRLVPLPGLERVLLAARRIDHELQALSEDFVRETALLHGKVRIGLQAPMLERPLIAWVSRMKREQPFLTVSIEYGMRQRLLDDLHASRLDMVAINLLGVSVSGRFETRTLCLEHCLIQADGALLTVSEVLDNWVHYVDRTWLLPVKGMAMRDRLDQVLQARSLPLPDRLIEISVPHRLEELRSACDAVALVPVSLLSEAQHARLPVLDGGLPGDDFFMEHGIAWARGIERTAPVAYALSVMSSLPEPYGVS
ncbi:LysR family transcriptional regulator [Asaia krungthepensis]|uniref:LysR family transcriptional regulator n=1 Tax=Asaia krungthepensis NRIC 0535 TaxID=1307925 RepID=A0ABQ0PVL3_9PROT|nr:LysR family transcriptional regulator [Asaia krungthepensis]GBQ82720.1 LysR family transcriptional regulator [Asaia krungthepensis NRIC 0535]